jgi:hypothetical protein
VRQIAIATCPLVICCGYPAIIPSVNLRFGQTKKYFTGWGLVKAGRAEQVRSVETISESCKGLEIAQQDLCFFGSRYLVPNLIEIHLVFSDMKHTATLRNRFILKMTLSFFILSTNNARVLRKWVVGPCNVCTRCN